MFYVEVGQLNDTSGSYEGNSESRGTFFFYVNSVQVLPDHVCHEYFLLRPCTEPVSIPKIRQTFSSLITSRVLSVVSSIPFSSFFYIHLDSVLGIAQYRSLQTDCPQSGCAHPCASRMYAFEFFGAGRGRMCPLLL